MADGSLRRWPIELATLYDHEQVRAVFDSQNVANAGYIDDLIKDITFGVLATATGTLNATLDDTALTASGTVSLSTAVSYTLGFTYTCASTLSDTGTLSATLADTALTASGTVDVVGALSTTLANTSLAAAGTVSLSTAVSYTLGFTYTCVSALSDTGTLNTTLASTSLSAAGAVSLSTAVNYTLGFAYTCASTVSDTGTVNTTLANTGLSASGTVSLSTAVGYTLGFTYTCASALSVTGTLNTTIGDTSITASGGTYSVASLGVSLGPAVLSGVGTVSLSAAVAGTVGFTYGISSALSVTGTLSSSLGSTGLTANAGALVTGSLSVVLDDVWTVEFATEEVTAQAFSIDNAVVGSSIVIDNGDLNFPPVDIEDNTLEPSRTGRNVSGGQYEIAPPPPPRGLIFPILEPTRSHGASTPLPALRTAAPNPAAIAGSRRVRTRP